MVIGIGIDIVEVRRISSALRGTKTMVERVFTAREIEYCGARKNQYQHFGGRFAGKEAALKALGTGWSQGIHWKDVEIVEGESGKPELLFHGKAREILDSMNVRRAWISITHSSEHAMAMVVLEE